MDVGKMDKYVPPLRIRVNQVAPEPISSLSPNVYKPPSRISSYSSQKTAVSTPDYTSVQDFPTLNDSKGDTPKSSHQKQGGWSQLAKDWAEKDRQEQARKIAEEEKKTNCLEERASGTYFSRSVAPSFIKVKKTVSFDKYDYSGGDEGDHGDEYEEEKYEENKCSNPLGITKDSWYQDYEGQR
jgi:hypothetical protein